MCAHRYLRLESNGARFSLTLEAPQSSSTLTPLWLHGCLDPVKYPGILYHSVSKYKLLLDIRNSLLHWGYTEKDNNRTVWLSFFI